MSSKPLDPRLAKAHADFIRPYLERERARARAEKKYGTANIIDLEAHRTRLHSHHRLGGQRAVKEYIDSNPESAPLAAEFQLDPATVRAQFAAADPAAQQFIRDAHAEGLIDGLRAVTIYASPEEAIAAWDALPGYVELSPKYPPRK